jgi:activating signal cointegrator 1
MGEPSLTPNKRQRAATLLRSSMAGLTNLLMKSQQCRDAIKVEIDQIQSHMKTLTLTEPWATLMRLGEKNIETRSWKTNYRGPLAIHAAKTMPKYAEEYCHDDDVIAAFMRHDWQMWFRFGCIVCIRELIDIQPTQNLMDRSFAKERLFGDFRIGRYGWIFAPGIYIVSPPVRVRGQQGLWDWEP